LLLAQHFPYTVSRCGVYKMKSNKAVVYTHVLHAKATCTIFTLRDVIQYG